MTELFSQKKRSWVAMLNLALFCALCVLGLSACSGDDDDEDSDDDIIFTQDACSAIGLKIANGTACTLGDTPAASPIVRLSIITAGGGLGTCTGTVIDSNIVLTAAHCFMDGFVGVQVDTFTGSFGVNQVVVHPQFDASDYELGGVLHNDAALVFTDQGMGVATAPLLYSRAPILGEEAIVAGFGETFPGSDTGQIYAGNAVVSGLTTQHVVIDYTREQSHPCAGDSGGPLLLNVGGAQTISGIVSQSDPSVEIDNICRPGDETLYTNVQDPAIFGFIQQYAPNASVL
ncbi:MAG TPA: trypsin-like serine protease [Oligoflexia bacterium]|nr:trypsin-like serine protease [Oligoflexia bacterium]